MQNNSVNKEPNDVNIFQMEKVIGEREYFHLPVLLETGVPFVN